FIKMIFFTFCIMSMKHCTIGEEIDICTIFVAYHRGNLVESNHRGRILVFTLHVVDSHMESVMGFII
ncbi:MAG: hypothetical protein ACTTH5_04670, partial [Wolinella sp.]